MKTDKHEGVDALDALLEKQSNRELFVRDGESLVFYIYVSTEELKQRRNKLAALVRGGGGRAESRKANGAHYRIRFEKNAARRGMQGRNGLTPSSLWTVWRQTGSWTARTT